MMKTQEIIENYMDDFLYKGKYEPNCITVNEMLNYIKNNKDLHIIIANDKELKNVVNHYCDVDDEIIDKTLDDDYYSNLFIGIENNSIIGIDNRTNDCWVEEFKLEDPLMALMWITDRMEIDCYLNREPPCINLENDKQSDKKIENAWDNIVNELSDKEFDHVKNDIDEVRNFINRSKKGKGM